MEKFLVKALPGASQSAIRLRTDIINFAASPSSKSVLLTGPVGAGKSTLARLIGLLKRVAHLNSDEVQKILSEVPTNRANQIDIRYMTSWYVEMALTGLVETLAEAQLFGSVSGAFTGANERPGIFEQALTGRISKKDPSLAAQVTGGIVFLDEVGDLSEGLQAKLLPVLSGGAFYRVGAEGRSEAELQFNGVLISASWKRLDEGGLRPDLYSRLAGSIIHVPGIDDRPEDFNALLTEIENGVLASLRNNISRIEIDPSAARSWLSKLREREPLDEKLRQRLATIKWGANGNLRGLTSAVEQLLTSDADPEQILKRFSESSNVHEAEQSEHGLLEHLLQRGPSGDGLAAHVRSVELEARRKLRDQLTSSQRLRSQVAGALGLDTRKLQWQVRQLDRARRAGGQSDD
nr:sigma 54-interacting transcriptional regulator [Bradyrhizobium sp. 168]